MIKPKIAALFPGQGSQAIGMGKAWHDDKEEARDLFSLADKLLGFPLSTLCFEGPESDLTLTRNAQPTLLLCSYLSFHLSGIDVAAAAGHSLGEYTALVAAGVIKLEDALPLVNKRGIYMQEAVPVGVGAMSAVMGPTEEELLSYIEEAKSQNENLGVVEIANINSPGQIVIAGEAESIQIFNDFLAAKSAKVIPLKVSAPFHCSLMKDAEIKLAKDLDSITFSDPVFPVYSNYSGKKIQSGSEARELLKSQVCGTVRWTSEVKTLMEEQSITHAVEFGPGGVLSKLLKRTCPEVSRLEVFDSESAGKAKTQLEI